MLGHFQEKKSENFRKLFYCHWIRGIVTPSSYICWYRNSDKKLSIYFGPRSTFSRASLSLFERFENLPKAFSRRNRFGNDRLSRDAKGLCLGWIPGIFGIWAKNSNPNSQGIGWNILYPRIQRGFEILILNFELLYGLLYIKRKHVICRTQKHALKSNSLIVVKITVIFR